MSGRLLDKGQLLALLDKVSNPSRHDLIERTLDQAMTDFCAGCPDPVQARRLIVECLDPMSDEELVDRALSMACVDISEVPTSIIPFDHPARPANERVDPLATVMRARLLDKGQLLELLGKTNNPGRHGLGRSGQDQALIDFCAGCPDPIWARYLIMECLDPMTDEELVDRAMSVLGVQMSDVPTSIIPSDHPARMVT